MIGTALGALLMILRVRAFHWVPKKVEKTNRSAFSLFHIWDCIHTTFKSRPGRNRRYFLILMTLFSVPIFPYCGDYFIDYYYVRTQFSWGFTDYSNYATIVQGAALVGMTTYFSLKVRIFQKFIYLLWLIPKLVW